MTVKAALVSAVALTFVFEVLALIAAATPWADSDADETLKLAAPAEPDTATLPVVKAPGVAPEVIA